MDRKKYSSAIFNANYKANLWMVISGVLLVANLMLSAFVLTADTTEKTIIVPPVMNKPLEIQGLQVSASYVEEMARYFSQLLLTYQKANALFQFNTVLRYTSPEDYSALKIRLDTEYDRIVKNDISSVFYLQQIHVRKQTAIVTGQLIVYLGTSRISSSIKSFELRFNFNGILHLIGFNEVQRTGGSYQQVNRKDETQSDNTIFLIEPTTDMSQ